MIKECYLYWLHIPNHSSIEVEGYVGISNNPTRRFYMHKANAKYSNPHLNNALKKYGKLVKCSILCKGTREYCLYLEAKLRSKKGIGWNIAIGGGDPPNPTGRVASKETRQKASERVVSNETRQKLSRSLKGKNKGKPSAFKGKHHTAENRILIGSYHKNKVISKEQIEMSRIKNSGSGNYKSITITLKHKEVPEKVFVFDNIRIAAEKLGLNYPSLRSQHQTKTKRYNRKGWAIVYK